MAAMGGKSEGARAQLALGHLLRELNSWGVGQSLYWIPLALLIKGAEALEASYWLGLVLVLEPALRALLWLLSKPEQTDFTFLPLLRGRPVQGPLKVGPEGCDSHRHRF